MQEALREYKGTVIIASHDLYFLRQIMNRVVEAADYRLRDYSGDCNVCPILSPQFLFHMFLNLVSICLVSLHFSDTTDRTSS